MRWRIVAAALIWVLPTISGLAAEKSTTWGKDGRSFIGDWSVRGHGQRDAGYHDPATVNIQRSSITISPFFDGKVLHTGAASTFGHFAMGSGVVVATLKICLKAPLRTAIWLQSPNNSALKGEIQNGRELDIAEIYTSRLNYNIGKVTHTVHAGGYGVEHRYEGSRGALLATCEPHTYEARFGATGYGFYVDGKQQWSLDQPFDGDKEYLIFSVEAPKKSNYNEISVPGNLGYVIITAVKVDEIAR